MNIGTKIVKYEVRSKGHGTYKYFTEPAFLPHYTEVKYDEHSIRSARKYAKHIRNVKNIEAWVVKITEEVI